MLRGNMARCVVCTLLLCFCAMGIRAQWVISGTVRDSISGDALPFTSIRMNSAQTITDGNGTFKFNISDHIIEIDAFHTGYRKFHFTLSQPSNSQRGDLVFDIRLKPLSSDINTIVVSGSKYGKTIAEEVVSISSINNNYVTTRNLDEADKMLNRLPGVTIMDGQPQIRGGSGYAYGAGSRVQVLYDDMPLISADAGDVKWDMLPMESTGRIEVLKGAGSALYGSGAINGVINFRPAIPTDTPHFQAAVWYGKYATPKNPLLKWWGDQKLVNQPFYEEGTFNYLRKIRHLDVNAGVMTYKQESFRQGETYNRLRGNIKLNWNVNKKMRIGLGSIAMYNNNSTFFFWQNDTTGAYKPFGGTSLPGTTLSHFTIKRLTIDPAADYYATNGDKHTIRLRMFYNDNYAVDVPSQSSNAVNYYAQYQYQHTFFKRLILTSGVSYTYNTVDSKLFKNHFSRNPAFFTQLEYKFKKLTLQGGVRAESYLIDTVHYNLKPIFRAGANYNVWRGGFLRGSIGQGFRYPAIAEKFTQTSVGGLNIFSNPALQPEHGYSSELGLLQFFVKGNVNGMVDLAAFDMEMRDFIDFIFNPKIPVKHGYVSGFKAINIEDASIKGMEFNTLINYKMGKTLWHISGGLTYLNPINNKVKHTIDSLLGRNSNLPVSKKDSLNNLKYLTYRSKFTAKLTVSVDYKKWNLYVDITYMSYVINVDHALNMLPGVDNYRKHHKMGDWPCDAGLGYNFNKHFNVSAIVRNVFNIEYSYRPALLEEPINYCLKAKWSF